MTDEQALKCVALAVAAYPNAPEVTTTTQLIWVAHLRDLDYHATRGAISQLIATNRFLPTVAEIRAAVLELETGDTPTADEAWAEVLGALNSGREQFSNPLIHRAVSTIGMRTIRMSQESQLPVHRAHFVKAYEILRAREVHRALTDTLELDSPGGLSELEEHVAQEAHDRLPEPLKLVGRGKKQGPNR